MLIAAALGLSLTLGTASAYAEPIANAGTIGLVDGGSTGDGGMSDEGCQNMAHIVNVLNDQAGQELQNHGNGAKWGDLMHAIDWVQNLAMDSGCFLVDPI
jgi:hypothetical protein